MPIVCWVVEPALSGVAGRLQGELPDFCNQLGLPGALLESALTSRDGAPLVQTFIHGEQVAFAVRFDRHLIVVSPNVMLYAISGAGAGELEHSTLVQAMDRIEGQQPLALPAMCKMLEIVTLEVFTDAGVPHERPVRAWLRGRYGAASATLNALAGDGAAVHKMLTVGGAGGQQGARQVR